MRRDLDLVRKILFALENKSHPKPVKTLAIDGYDDLMVRYHLVLLAQAKLIDFEPSLTKTGRIISVLAFNPSWHGHEFLDAVRNDTVWQKVKRLAADKSVAIPFEIAKSAAVARSKPY